MWPDNQFEIGQIPPSRSYANQVVEGTALGRKDINNVSHAHYSLMIFTRPSATGSICKID